MSGTILKVQVKVGDVVAAGAVVVILEAMKMETEVRARNGGAVTAIACKAGDTVGVGDELLTLA